jgi:hypothetical protein
MPTPLDRAIADHMAHGAMTGQDPLTDCLYAQMAPQPTWPDEAPDDTPPGPDLPAAERRAYAQGWAWGVVCGLCAGVCTTGTAVWLWHLAAAALACPTC